MSSSLHEVAEVIDGEKEGIIVEQIRAGLADSEGIIIR